MRPKSELLLICVFSLGTFVIKVTANDADDPTSGYHARILYNLEQGQPYFSVEPTTGICELKEIGKFFMICKRQNVSTIYLVENIFCSRCHVSI